ncbi:hypothetical protein C0Q70_19268 [Pomacea canaliculata]|uniref:Uncharacterized protein n=1 Tax=Pomacea canaliculata TaxID=400727 RepID=A0A2T7NIX1_POMCA|nr:hypothetical protein C0Q70_19268 [Pomacea canaliculata]
MASVTRRLSVTAAQTLKRAAAGFSPLHTDPGPPVGDVTSALGEKGVTFFVCVTSDHADLLCGKEISLGLEKTAAAMLVLTSSDCRPGVMDCGVRVRSDQGSQMMLSFLSLDLGFGRCLDEYVEITNNDNGSIEAFNASGELVWQMDGLGVHSCQPYSPSVCVFVCCRK